MGKKRYISHTKSAFECLIMYSSCLLILKLISNYEVPIHCAIFLDVIRRTQCFNAFTEFATNVNAQENRRQVLQAHETIQPISVSRHSSPYYALVQGLLQDSLD
jgi:hypothetical protein